MAAPHKAVALFFQILDIEISLSADQPAAGTLTPGSSNEREFLLRMV
jgi:hypothetical protein